MYMYVCISACTRTYIFIVNKVAPFAYHLKKFKHLKYVFFKYLRQQ